MRAVIYNDSRGGYINNVPGPSRASTDVGIHYVNYPVPSACPYGLPDIGGLRAARQPGRSTTTHRRQRHQSGDLQGIRAEALYKFNDDWNVLITPELPEHERRGCVLRDAEGTRTAQPLQPLEVTLFNPSYDKDKFENTAWTVNGKFGPLKAVYTGGYLVRNVDQVSDYTNYARGVYADYYQCSGQARLTTRSRRPVIRRARPGATARRTRTRATSFA